MVALSHPCSKLPIAAARATRTAPLIFTTSRIEAVKRLRLGLMETIWDSYSLRQYISLQAWCVSDFELDVSTFNYTNQSDMHKRT